MKLLLYEGYLRNRKALCKELGVSPGISCAETERKLLLAGYERWGCEIGNHLYGSFSFVLSDEERKELICVRDLFGIRPFYYTLLPDGELLFDTDIRRMARDPRYRRALDEEALQLYMMFGYPAGERTLYRGIKKLMPGKYLVWKNGQYRIGTCFAPTFRPENDRSEEELAERIDQTLQDILEEDRENFDFSRGCAFLSGGVDSSYLFSASGVERALGIGYATSSRGKFCMQRTSFCSGMDRK